ncbi:MAG: hypothetical protein QME74_06005 [Candidatus Edwardsbacteria bacterium]|nr:hypothetical protein [Candidatus Edwardsbacteria bacterium]
MNPPAMNRFLPYIKPLAIIVGSGILLMVIVYLFITPFYLYCPSPGPAANTKERLTEQLPEKKTFYYQSKYRDPFLPGGMAQALRPAPVSPGYRLKGVVWDAKRPLAVVMDNQGVTVLVRSGEKIGGDRLLSITHSNAVLLRPNGTRYELKTWE